MTIKRVGVDLCFTGAKTSGGQVGVGARGRLGMLQCCCETAKFVGPSLCDF